MCIGTILKITGGALVGALITIVPNLIIKETVSHLKTFKETNEKIDELLAKEKEDEK